MLKLPSVQTLLDALYATAKRFPLPILFTLYGCITCMRILHGHEEEVLNASLTQQAMCAYLGMLLSLGAAVFAERRKYRSAIRALIQLGAVVLVLAYYYAVPAREMNVTDWLRTILFVLGLHLFIAFAPFLVRNEANGFWQYNEQLFLRFLTSLLYSFVLFCGLALALLAVDKLFHADIDPDRYGDLWIWIVGGFNTVFFLAGFPSGYAGLERVNSYPRGLKIFTQYVLLPLVTIYILILYAYMFKIIVTREWPSGWVSWLVLSFSIAGILSLLLIHPIRNEESNKWIGLFSHGFYIALCPLIVLLFLAIEKRISAYGITIERYCVLSLSIWLALIALYFLVSRGKSIKVLPVSLCLFVFLASFGPWGAFSVPMHSQRARLGRLLAKNGMLPHGKFVTSGRPVSFGDIEQINSIIDYLAIAHGYRSMQPLFAQNLDSLMGYTLDGRLVQTDRAITYRYEQSEKIKGLMQMTPPVDSTEDHVATQVSSYSYTTAIEDVLPLKGYDFLIRNYIYHPKIDRKPSTTSFPVSGHTVTVNVQPDTWVMTVGDERGKPVSIPLPDLLGRLLKSDYSEGSLIPPKEMSFLAENEFLSLNCLFIRLQGVKTNGKFELYEASANILVRFKK